MSVKEDLTQLSEELELAIKMNSYTQLEKVSVKFNRYVQALPKSLVLIKEDEYEEFKKSKVAHLTSEWSLKA